MLFAVVGGQAYFLCHRYLGEVEMVARLLLGVCLRCAVSFISNSWDIMIERPTLKSSWPLSASKPQNGHSGAWFIASPSLNIQAVPNAFYA